MKIGIPLIIIMITALTAAVILGALIIQKSVSSTVQKKISALYSADQIILADTMANFFGEESLGAVQLRGNGGLVLTRENLNFHMLVPDRTITIPLADILEVKLVKSHLGKSVGKNLLYVKYSTPAGTEAIAWYVQEPELWVKNLKY